MNLKQAAGRLGVHYQTAYKWVRSGELAAIRVGGRYEVSEAAIEQLTARRAAARYEPVTESDPRPVTVTADDVLEQLEAMAMDPFVSANAVATFAARRGAELLGDLCIVTCFDDSGRIETLQAGHPDPAHGTVVASAIDQLGFPLTSLGLAFSDDQPVRLPHVPQDLLRAELRPELLQHLPFNPVLSLLSVPLGFEGHRCGALSFVRTQAHRPYTEDDEQFAVTMAARIGPLLQTAKDVSAALGELRRVAQVLRRLVDDEPRGGIPTATIQQLVDDGPPGEPIAVGVVDAELRYVAANDVVVTIRREPVDAFVGAEYDADFGPDERPPNSVGFDELRSGELDFATVAGRRLLPDGREFVYQSHRAAVRAADASLRFIVIVARPLRLPRSDYGDVPSDSFLPVAVHAPGTNLRAR